MIAFVATRPSENRSPGETVRTDCSISPGGHNWKDEPAQRQVLDRPGHGFHTDAAGEVRSCEQVKIILDSDTQKL